MQQRCFRPLAVIGLTTAVLLSHASMSEAQLSQAEVNMANARRLYQDISDAFSKDKYDEALPRLDEFRTNVQKVKIDFQGPVNRLHEKDRSVWFDKVDKFTQQLDVASFNAENMMKEIKDKRFSEAKKYYDTFKDRWRDADDRFKGFMDGFPSYWNRDMKELQERVKEYQDRIKRFQEACGRTCS